MLNIYSLNIISFTGLAIFFSGCALSFIVYFSYHRFRKGNINTILSSISDSYTNENNPLRTWLSNLPNNVYIKDKNGRYIVANDNFAHQLKLVNSIELIGKKDSDFYSEPDSLTYETEDQIILSGKKDKIVREQKSDKDGSIKYTIITKTPFKDKNGTIQGLVGIVTDITEQKLIEKELKTQNDQIEKERNLLRTLIDSIPDAIYIKDHHGCYLEANPALVDITKAKSREYILSKSDYDFYPKDIADIFAKDDKHILRTGEAVIGKEEIGFDTDGNIRVRSTSKVPFYDKQGDIAGLVGIGRDITKLKETEEKLIEQAQNLQEINVLLEERQEEINQQADELNEKNSRLEKERTLLRTVIDNIPDFIYIKDKNSKFITANQQMAETFNLRSPEELNGKTDFDFFPKDLADKFYLDEQTIIRTGSSLNALERTGFDKNGNVIHTVSTKVPYKNSKGEIEGIVGISKDITAQKETEFKLNEQAVYLTEVNTLLEERQEEIQQQSSELSHQNSILENERNLLRVLINNIPDSIFIKDTNSRFVLGNKNLLRNLKLSSHEQLEGKTDFEFYTKERAAIFFEDEQKIISSRNPIINKEEIRILDDGTEKIRFISKIPYFDESNRILGIVCISKDITELKNIHKKLKHQANDLLEVNELLEDKANEVLKQSKWLAEQNSILDEERKLLRTLIDNIPDYIYIKDKESRFITVNKRLLTTMHINSVENIIGLSDFDLNSDFEMAKEYFSDEQEIIKTGKSLINKEESGLDEYGKKRVISTTKVPFYDSEGKVRGIVGIGRDITKQKNTETQLIEQAENLKEVNTLLEERQEKIQVQSEEINKQSSILLENNKQLEQLNATKNKFFSIIAHDLKNPFQAIFGFSELLMRNFDDFDEKQRIELLTMIKTSSESAYNLLENLLQWARTQTHRINYKPSIINIHDIIEQNVTLNMANTEKKSIAVQVNLTCSGVAWADFNMVNLIIRNLLSNAIKFTGTKGLVRISCEDLSESKCKISIADTGIGISEANIKKLFRIDEYFSTSGTAGETGTGLGLIICKEFIEKNLGQLFVESTLDEGTVFSFTLPRKAEHLN